MYKNNEDIKWLQFIRNAEFESALKFFPVEKNIKILEIGGSDGFLAEKINAKGYEIISIDQILKDPQHFPVIIGNATKLDFESEKFDMIFSSHVIAHIDNIELFFAECKRVLKKNGIMIHIVPSTAWSIGTNFWHYIFLSKLFTKWRRTNLSKMDIGNQNIKINKKEEIIKKIINILFLHPLGTNPSFIHEFYYFSKYRWRKVFQNHGFNVINVENGPYFYSGHNILKNQVYKLRKKLTKIGFTGSFCFVVKK